jgi:iron complex transport system ATP-binding protein
MLKVSHLLVKQDSKVLLSGIDSVFVPGRIHCVLGANGSGKTSLLKTIAGIWQPTQGQILWHGEDLLKKPRKEISQIITFVPASILIPYSISVMQFVNMGLYAQGLSHTKKGKDLLEESLRKMDAFHLANHSMHQLSQGEKQRILIARALATQAPILAFDEPTANADKKNQRLIWNLMQELKVENKVLLIATHDIPYSTEFADEVMALHQGTMISWEEFIRV